MPGYRSYIKTTLIGWVCTDDTDSLVYYFNYLNGKKSLYSYHLFTKKLVKYVITDTMIIEIKAIYKSGSRVFLRASLKGNNDITFIVNNDQTLTKYTSDSRFTEIDYYVTPSGDNLFTLRIDYNVKTEFGGDYTYLIVKADTSFSTERICYRSKAFMMHLAGITKGGTLIFNKNLTESILTGSYHSLKSGDNAIYAMEPNPPYKIIDLRPEEGIENDDNIWGFFDMYSVSLSKYADSVYVIEPYSLFKEVVIKSISKGGQRLFSEMQTDLSYSYIDAICDFDNLPFLVARLDQVRLVIKNINTNDVTEINTDSVPDEIKQITFIY